MKKTISILLTLILLMTLSSCGKKDASAQESPAESSVASAASESSESAGKASVPVKEEEVEATLPSLMFTDETEEDILAEAEAEGFLSARLNEDGTVTYRMTKTHQKTLLTQLEDEIRGASDELIKGEEATGCFRSIDWSDDYTSFDVTVDPELYTPLEGFSVMAFCLEGAFYQCFSGADVETVDSVVHFLDPDGEEVDHISYRDILSLSEAIGEDEPLDLPRLTEPTVVLDHEGVTVTALEHEGTTWERGIRMRIENNSSDTAVVSCEKVYVNGYYQTPYLYLEVAPGETAEELLSLYPSDLEAAGVETVGSVSVEMALYGSESYEPLYVAPLTELRTEAYDAQSKGSAPLAKTLLDQDGMRISVDPSLRSGDFGTAFAICYENDTERTLTFDMETCQVDGEEIFPWIHADLVPGSKAVFYLTLSVETPSESGGDTPEELKMVFTVQDSGEEIVRTEELEVRPS